ncbi:DEAD/DEAH box helicase [Clostridium culturomicium]|uniref:DEAD/DEAH box helicase n=1 Tax=Clostridium culturomicium TaxID=1499683 RepID=UPI0005AACC37|nr:type ISP restriction/modification enzyme [Clostridium culturomicium]
MEAVQKRVYDYTTVNGLLEQFKELYKNQRDKGTSFEQLIKSYLLIEPKYSSYIEQVWTWKEFPYRNAVGDTGIDLVAKTYQGEFWAIQCKFYDEDYSISKADVDTFLATSSKSFNVDGVKTSYSFRFIISTTDKYSKNAEDVLIDQNPPVRRIGMVDLLESEIDWKKFSINNEIQLKEKYKPKPHQRKAIDDVIEGFKNNDRGKLIMACGTGKTFTSLRIVEELLNGKGTVLFLVPSIALINQTMSEWTAQCNYTYDALVVCSDNKASKGENAVDLGIPSTTDVNRLYNYVNNIENIGNNMHFIFSTYQSIDVVSELQKRSKIKFDIVVCDEAHRTTGVTLGDSDESYFVKVHDNNFIQADKRLYMTATPRIFGDNVKNKAKDINAELCSMDNEEKYGPEFHNLTFSDAVADNLLTDYKVLVLAIDQGYVELELQTLLMDKNHELKMNDSVKIMGCWNGLSKKSIESEDDSFKVDPYPMKRAVAFCNQIKDSKRLVEMFNVIQEHIRGNNPKEAESLVNIEIQHVDGSFNALEKKEKINWLKEDSEENTCRILTNARCLSEGVNVPALDAVMFLNPRSSMVDIIQSVGRVMRKSPGKQYGYVMLPIVIPPTESPEDALDSNDNYRIVWSVLQALRAHDDRFNNTINKIELNKKKPDQIGVIGVGKSKQQDNDNGQTQTSNSGNTAVQLAFNLHGLDNWRDAIYAKMVKKVGTRMYWESWAKDVAEISKTHIRRINMLLEQHDSKIDKIFNDFVLGLKQNINSSISKEDAIEMLAQHMITKPVFDALFEGYEFVKSNPVSKTMQKMMDILDSKSLDAEKITLQRFYKSVRDRAADIDNYEGKQKIVIELYEKFFKTALPKEVEKLGIVYTPTECVDFIINSVESLLQQEFGKTLSDKGVHIIDGFTGTGTFIVRLIQSGIINQNNLIYKYTNEIHANEIVLLAYYIAAINIEEAFHHVMGINEYVPFNGIVLTDTFQLYEDWEEDEFTRKIYEEILPINSERAKKQRDLPITVCIGNPPYSVGQKSQNDNAQNIKYPKLDKRIAETYVLNSTSSMNKALYDAYIKAFRWSSDRIVDKGIIGFITNGSFIDGKASSGFRKCLIDEFTSIYVFNLRGNARTTGEQRKKEKDSVFGQGTRTPVAITCLVKNPDKKNDGYVNYCDIGDYLTRNEKLNIIKNNHDVGNIEWKKIYPDDNNDWINKCQNKYKDFIAIAGDEKSFFTINTSGVVTSRDKWVYNFSYNGLINNMESTISTYNYEISRCENRIKNDYNGNIKNFSFKDNVTADLTKISWSRGLLNSMKTLKEKKLNKNNITIGQYRPYQKQVLYYTREFNECVYKNDKVFKDKNIAIMTSGVGNSKPFSCLMTNIIPNFDTLFHTQSFPLYWYEEVSEVDLFNINGENRIVRHDGISDYILKQCQKKYKTKDISKENIFYYVYGILHSSDYRNTFESDLKKSLSRIPLVDSYDNFSAFSKLGEKLADLHVNYEEIPIYDKVTVTYYKEDYFVQKMKFNKKNKQIDKSCIIYNPYITISNIPEKAYEYIINGKSAIEWIIERYQLDIDKKSGIKNDPNDWCKEVGDDKYIFNLLLRVINVSVQTVDIVNSLPKLDFE